MIACVSAVARTAPLLSTRGASIHNACERIYRFRLPTPALPAKRFPMLRTFGLQTLDGRSVRRGYPLKSAS